MDQCVSESISMFRNALASQKFLLNLDLSSWNLLLQRSRSRTFSTVSRSTWLSVCCYNDVCHVYYCCGSCIGCSAPPPSLSDNEDALLWWRPGGWEEPAGSQDHRCQAAGLQHLGVPVQQRGECVCWKYREHYFIHHELRSAFTHLLLIYPPPLLHNWVTRSDIDKSHSNILGSTQTGALKLVIIPQFVANSRQCEIIVYRVCDSFPVSTPSSIHKISSRLRKQASMAQTDKSLSQWPHCQRQSLWIN